MTLRAAFMGTPGFAVPTLTALHDMVEIQAVISQPDKPSGRGLKVQPTPTKACAQQLGLAVYQPTSLRDSETVRWLESLKLDLIVVVAYGKILPRSILELPRYGCINVHASLLPRWRGAAPVQWAIYYGDTHTGVTLMRMDEGMDTGPILSQIETPIDAFENAKALLERLSQLGGEILKRDLWRYVQGDIVPVPQNERGVTMAPLIDKAHGNIQWSRTASEIHNQIRAMSPWPSAYTYWGNRRIKVHCSHVVSETPSGSAPGIVLQADSRGIEVACGSGILSLDELQMEGKSRVKATAFVAGHRWQPQQQLKEGPV